MKLIKRLKRFFCGVSMHDVYIKQVQFTAAADGDDYLYDEQLDPAKILVITNLSATWSAMATSEQAHFFVEVGGTRMFLGEDVPFDTGGYPHWSGKIAIGEGCRIGVYCPDIETGDRVSLFIFGELWDREDWMQK